LCAALLASSLTGIGADARASNGLIAATVRAAVTFTSGKAGLSGGTSATAAALAEGALHGSADSATGGQRELLANTCHQLGDLQDDLGEAALALDSYQRTRDLYEELTRVDPASGPFQIGLVNAYHRIQRMHRQQGAYSAASADLERAANLVNQLVQMHPTEALYQRLQALHFKEVGRLKLELQAPLDAVRIWDQARRCYEKLIGDQPLEDGYKDELATIHLNMGGAQVAYGAHDKAIRSYSQARALYERLAQENPTVVEYQWDVAATCVNLAGVEGDRKSHNAAIKFAYKARDLFEKLMQANPTVVRFQLGLAAVHQHLRSEQLQAGELEKALKSHEASCALLDKLMQANPSEVDTRRFLGCSLIEYGQALGKLKRTKEARSTMRRGLALLHGLVESASQSDTDRRNLSEGYDYLADVEFQDGLYSDAVAAARKSIEFMSKDSPHLYEAVARLARCIPLVSRGQDKLSAREQSLRRQYENEAVEVFRRAVAAGFKDADAVQKSRDLDPLRSNQDFQRLLADLRAEAGNK
jgi:tetratricopeptide (TPR) repeat protein